MVFRLEDIREYSAGLEVLLGDIGELSCELVVQKLQ